MNSIKEIQNQIRAFNKQLQRAEKAGSLSNEFYEQIYDLIDYERMTAKGYAMAGTRYLENMNYKDILAYQSDIKQAKGLIELATIASKINIQGAKDAKSLLWKMHDKLIAAGLPVDSDLVHAVAEGEVDIDYKKFAMEMYKYLTKPDYGLSDLNEWYNAQVGLED